MSEFKKTPKSVEFIGMNVTKVCKNLDLANEAKTEEECGKHLRNAHKDLMKNLFKTFDNHNDHIV